jgi:hypothetical protein
MRMRLGLAVLVLAGAMALVACGDDEIAADTGSEPPNGPGVDVGQSYDYALYTHCGIEWARIDGVWWRTEPLDDGNGNPPRGWGNPYDSGQLHIVDETTAIYSGGPDGNITFERTDLAEAPFFCG